MLPPDNNLNQATTERERALRERRNSLCGGIARELAVLGAFPRWVTTYEDSQGAEVCTWGHTRLFFHTSPNETEYSEALALRWSDIDWLASTITIQRSIVERHVDTPKTENSAETMILSKELVSRIQLWRQQTQFPAEGDWIFASPVKIGRLPYSYTGVWRRLQQAAENAALGKLGTHAFRHSYRSWLDMVGTALAVQKKAMPHSDLGTTMKYGDIIDGRVDQALEKVSGLVFANSTQTARRDS